MADAVSDATTAIDAQPWAASGYLQRALVLEHAGLLGRAALDARRATQKEPTNWQTWLILGRIEAERGRESAALEAARRARALNPRSPLFGPPRRMMRHGRALRALFSPCLARSRMQSAQVAPQAQGVEVACDAERALRFRRPWRIPEQWRAGAFDVLHERPPGAEILDHAPAQGDAATVGMLAVVDDVPPDPSETQRSSGPHRSTRRTAALRRQFWTRRSSMTDHPPCHSRALPVMPSTGKHGGSLGTVEFDAQAAILDPHFTRKADRSLHQRATSLS